MGTAAIQCTCGRAIAAADVNEAQGVALCRGCRRMWPLGEGRASAPGANTTHWDGGEQAKAMTLAAGEPPPGCRVRERDGMAVLVASARGPMAFFAIVLALMFNVFAARELSALASRASGAPLSSADLLFALPIAAGALVTAGSAIGLSFGRYEVRLHGDEGALWLGLGPLGRTRRFDAGLVRAVRFEQRTVGSGEDERVERLIALKLEGAGGAWKSLELGVFLTERRRLWLGGTLAKLLDLPGPGLRIVHA